jgi:hypothetical protein
MANPSALRFEPMTVGMILDATFRLYLQNVGLILGIATLAHVPYFLFLVGFNALLFDAMTSQFLFEATASSVTAVFVGAVLMVCLYLWSYALSQGGITYAISERYLQRPITVFNALQVVWRRCGTLLWATFIVGFIVGFGFLLLIIPGILWALSYTLVVPVVLLETHDAARSRQRSWSLVEGYRGKAFVVLLTFGVLWVLIALGLQSALIFLLGGTAGILGKVVGELVSLLLMPFVLIADVLLYYDLRMRKEGFDLEMLSQALAQQER